MFQYAIALTGSIATGKSTVVSCIKEQGFHVIDADTIAHEILDQHSQAIVALFGEAVVKDEKIDRKALGALVFADPLQRKQLEALLHPLIFDEIKRYAQIEEQQKKIYFIDIPLFFETKRYPIEKSLVVYATREQQLERLIAREGYTEQEANQRIDSQILIEEKVKWASYVIDNSGTLMELKAQCKRIIEEIGV